MAQSDVDNHQLKVSVDRIMKNFINGVYRWNATSFERKEGYKNFLKTFIQNARKKEFRLIARQAYEKHWREYENSSYFTETAQHFVYRLTPTDKHSHIYRMDSRSVFYKFNHPAKVTSPVPCGYEQCSLSLGEDSSASIISVACNSSCQMFFHLPCYYKQIETSGILCIHKSKCFALWITYQVYASNPEDFLNFVKVDELDVEALECVESPLSAQGRPLDENSKETEVRIARRLQVMKPQEEFEREAEIVKDIVGVKINDPNLRQIVGTEVLIRLEASPQKAFSRSHLNLLKKNASALWKSAEDLPLLTFPMESPRKRMSNASTDPIVQSSHKGTDVMEIRKRNKSTTTKNKSRGTSNRWTQFTSEVQADKSTGMARRVTAEQGTGTPVVTKVDAQTETFIRSSVAVGIQTGRVKLQDYLISNHQLHKLDEEFIHYRYEEFNARSKLLKAAANISLENGRIQVVRSNSLINAFRLMVNELRQQRSTSPLLTEALRSYLRVLVHYRNDVERWIGEVEERCYSCQSNEDYIRPILESSAEFILGLFPVPNPPEMDKELSDRILNEIFVTGFLNYNDRNNFLIKELVEDAIRAFPIAGTDAAIWCMYHIRRKVDYLDGLNMAHALKCVLTEFTNTVLSESRKLVVYIT